MGKEAVLGMNVTVTGQGGHHDRLHRDDTTQTLKLQIGDIEIAEKRTMIIMPQIETDDSL